ncbi:hypothetical protein EVAR_4531_1 [Eumeta japonica]|uniref:Uncharacterized protein n=1 Tax=Eumeta variegata TaxID=151549 RepID=A0A4C1SWR1_EUMVA|nr:hypothetical protein EVAR_4531_1 [Eumeta japonica]
MNDAVKKRGVKVNAGKTKVMVFERGEGTTACDILIDGEKVEQAKDLYTWIACLQMMVTDDSRHRIVSIAIPTDITKSSIDVFLKFPDIVLTISDRPATCESPRTFVSGRRVSLDTRPHVTKP